MKTEASPSSATSPATTPKYWAFIAYRPEDARIAHRLHASLETYRIPQKLRGKMGHHGLIPTRAFPVFLDSEELPLKGRRSEDIKFALEQSRYLIVVCSRREGDWSEVDQQIRLFKSLGGNDRIICSLAADCSGISDSPQSMGEVLPPALGTGTDPAASFGSAEPVLVPHGQRATLELLARMVGVDFDELHQRDVLRQHRRLQLLLTGASIFLLIFAMMGIEMFNQNRKARENESRANAEAEDAKHQKVLAQKARAEAEQQLQAAKAELERLKRTSPAKKPE